MATAKNDLLFYLSRDGGMSGFYFSIASTHEDGNTRAEDLVQGLIPFLAEGVTVTTKVKPSRFAPNHPLQTTKGYP